ncbi:MAG: hypothetical protein Q7J72_00440, partial [Candidatus Omnitrophota bacterium]|nr:hypothetical protein [Candidatus Omnitrophota bacterium]
ILRLKAPEKTKKKEKQALNYNIPEVKALGDLKIPAIEGILIIAPDKNSPQPQAMAPSGNAAVNSIRPLKQLMDEMNRQSFNSLSLEERKKLIDDILDKGQVGLHSNTEFIVQSYARLLSYVDIWPEGYKTEETIQGMTGNLKSLDLERLAKLRPELEKARWEKAMRILKEKDLQRQIIQGQLEAKAGKDISKDKELKELKKSLEQINLDIEQLVKSEKISAKPVDSTKDISLRVGDLCRGGIWFADLTLENLVKKDDYSQLVSVLNGVSAVYAADIFKHLSQGEITLDEASKLLVDLYRKKSDLEGQVSAKRNEAKELIRTGCEDILEIITAKNSQKARQKRENVIEKVQEKKKGSLALQGISSKRQDLIESIINKNSDAIESIFREYKPYLEPEIYRSTLKTLAIYQRLYRQEGIEDLLVNDGQKNDLTVAGPSADLARRLDEQVKNNRYCQALLKDQLNKEALEGLYRQLREKGGKGIDVSLLNFTIVLSKITLKTGEERSGLWAKYQKEVEAINSWSEEALKYENYLYVLRNKGELNDEEKNAVVYYEIKQSELGIMIRKEIIEGNFRFLQFLREAKQDLGFYLSSDLISFLILNAASFLQKMLGSVDPAEVNSAKQSLNKSVEELISLIDRNNEGRKEVIAGKEEVIKEEKWFAALSGSFLLREVITRDNKVYLGYYPMDEDVYNLVHNVIYRDVQHNSAMWVSVDNPTQDVLNLDAFNKQNLRLNTSQIIPISELGDNNDFALALRIDTATLLQSQAFGGTSDIMERRIGLELSQQNKDIRYREFFNLFMDKDGRPTYVIGVGRDTKTTGLQGGIELDEEGNISFFAGARKLYSINGNPGQVALNYQKQTVRLRYQQRLGSWEVGGLIQWDMQEATLILGQEVQRYITKNTAVGMGVQHNTEDGQTVVYGMVTKRGSLGLGEASLKLGCSLDGQPFVQILARKTMGNTEPYISAQQQEDSASGRVGTNYYTQGNNRFGGNLGFNSNSDTIFDRAGLDGAYNNTTGGIFMQKNNQGINPGGDINHNLIGGVKRNSFTNNAQGNSWLLTPQGNILYEQNRYKVLTNKIQLALQQRLEKNSALSIEDIKDTITGGKFLGFGDSILGLNDLELERQLNFFSQETDLPLYLGYGASERGIDLTRPIDFWEFVYWQDKLNAANEAELKAEIHRYAQLKDEIAAIMGKSANPADTAFVSALRVWVNETKTQNIDEIEAFLQRVKETKERSTQRAKPFVLNLNFTEVNSWNFVLAWTRERLDWQKEGLDSLRVFDYLADILSSQNAAFDFDSRAPPKVAEQIALAKKMAKESSQKSLSSRQVHEFLYVYNQPEVKELSADPRFNLSLQFAQENLVYIPSYLRSAITVIQEKVINNQELTRKYLSGISVPDKDAYQDRLLAGLILLQYKDNDLRNHLEDIVALRDTFEKLLNANQAKDVSYLGKKISVVKVDIEYALGDLLRWAKGNEILKAKGESLEGYFRDIPLGLFNGQPYLASWNDIQRFRLGLKDVSDKYAQEMKLVKSFYEKESVNLTAGADEVRLKSIKAENGFIATADRESIFIQEAFLKSPHQYVRNLLANDAHLSLSQREKLRALLGVPENGIITLVLVHEYGAGLGFSDEANHIFEKLYLGKELSNEEKILISREISLFTGARVIDKGYLASDLSILGRTFSSDYSGTSHKGSKVTANFDSAETKNATTTYSAEFETAVNTFYSDWQASAHSNDINTLILKPIYGIDLSDGLDDSDKTAFGNNKGPQYNPLYKENGSLKNSSEIQATVDFFAAVTVFYREWEASSKRDDINSYILIPAYDVDFSDYEIDLSDLTALGDDDASTEYNPLYKENTSLKNDSEIAADMDFYESAVDYYNAYKSSNTTKVDEVHKAFKHPKDSSKYLDLSDGINGDDLYILGYYDEDNKTGYGLIYKDSTTVRDPEKTMDFFEAVYDYKTAYDGSNKTKVDEVHKAFKHPSDSTKYLNLADTNGLDPDDIYILGYYDATTNTGYGLIYADATTIRDPEKTMDFFEAVYDYKTAYD